MNLLMFAFVALMGSVFAQNTSLMISDQSITINSQCLKNANAAVIRKENAWRTAMRKSIKKDRNYDNLSDYEVESMGPSSNSGLVNLEKSISHFAKERSSFQYEIKRLQGFVNFLTKDKSNDATVLAYTFTFSTVDEDGEISEGDNVDYVWFALIKDKSKQNCSIEFSQYRYRYEYYIFD